MLHTFPGLYEIKKSRHAVQRQPICIDDAIHDYIIDEIDCRGDIEYERQKHNDDK